MSFANFGHLGFESLGIEKLIKKRRMSEKVKEYLKSDCYMYSPMISSPPKLGSSVKGESFVPYTHLLSVISMCSS